MKPQGPHRLWRNENDVTRRLLSRGAVVVCLALLAASPATFGDDPPTTPLFNRSGGSNLLIGVPGEEFDDPSDSEHEGAINVLCGSASGLTATDDQFWAQYDPWVTGTAEYGDQFGKALAASQGPLIFDDGFELANANRWWLSRE